MNDEKQVDRKKLTTEQRLELLEEQVAALTQKVNLLFKNALWEREVELNRRGR
jgi:hypothetical protein